MQFKGHYFDVRIMRCELFVDLDGYVYFSIFWGNYSKLICGLARFHFAYRGLKLNTLLT